MMKPGQRLRQSKEFVINLGLLSLRQGHSFQGFFESETEAFFDGESTSQASCQHSRESQTKPLLPLGSTAAFRAFGCFELPCDLHGAEGALPCAHPQGE